MKARLLSFLLLTSQTHVNISFDISLQLARNEVVKKMWEIVKERKLQVCITIKNRRDHMNLKFNACANKLLVQGESVLSSI